jgi:hypothetical protein
MRGLDLSVAAGSLKAFRMWIFQSPRFFWPFVIARFAETDKWVRK